MVLRVQVAVCEALVKAGATWTYENNYGHTCLTLVCKDGNDKMVREIQRLGAPLDQETTFGNTALMQVRLSTHNSP
jgi:ankyrin repeat protein